MSYRNIIVNSLSETTLAVRDFHGQVVLGRRNLRYGSPRELNEVVYRPELDQALGWCWKGDDGEIKTSEEIADLCVARFFDLIALEARGELPDFED